MKDPKVSELCKELKELVQDINKVNKKLYAQDVSYRLEESYDESKGYKEFEIRYLQQKVEY